jgi:two-component system cell cycle response regulator DivK
LVGSAEDCHDKDCLQFGASNGAVRDSGPRISEADQVELFQEFQHAENSTSRKKGGIGHWGPGLDVFLLRSRYGGATDEASMTKRILIVEDQVDNRQIVRDLLTANDYEMTEAENGEEALAAAAKERPGLILMDIQLPVMDGYEATRRIKADPSLSSIPIIAVTSYALSGDEEKARAAGCNDFVPKPYSPRQLLAKIRKFLP